MNIPYQIVNIHLEQAIPIQSSKGGVFLIVWYKNFPLGHAWLDQGFADQSDLINTIINVISNTIHYYTDSESARKIVRAVVTSSINEINTTLAQLFNNALPSPINLPSLSVVICTRNRTDSLMKCIATLQKSIDTDFELIIVDNAPDDQSTEIAVTNLDNVIYVKEPKKGLDNARNAGAKFASKDIVAYTDDDVEVTPEWTSVLKKCFSNPTTMAVTGLVLPVSIKTASQYLFEKYWSFNRGYIPIVFDQNFFNQHKHVGVPVWEIGAGANMAFRKLAFDFVGYFDDRLDVGASGCSGDSEFWYKVLADGWNCHYFPQLVVWHNHREDIQSLNRQLFSYMRGQVSSLLVQYEKYKHRGDLARILKWLPLYYWHRVKDTIAGKDKEKNSTIWLEIKGCFSGAFFYWKHRRPLKAHHPYPLKLNDDAIVNDDTLVSVIITCYNYGHFLKQAIDSVLNQSYTNIEIIVVDDGSTDNTQEIIASFPTIRSIITNRVDVSAARNEGVKIARGNYVLFLDADDFLPPDAIQNNLYFFTYFPKAVFISGNFQKVDVQGVKLAEGIASNKKGDVYADLLSGNYIGMEGTILYRKELFACFQFDPNYKTAEFYDLNLRIARFFPVFSHDRMVAYYRQHNGSKSENKKMMWEMVQLILMKQKSLIANKTEMDKLEEGLLNWKNYLHEPGNN